MHIDTDILITWGAIIKNFAKGEIIFNEGNDAKYYFQLITGEVKLYNTNNDGKEYTQGIFSDGKSFGEPPLFIKEPYPATAIAVKESTIIKISSERFFKIVDDSPQIQKSLIIEFAKRIYNKSITAREIINNPPELRILGFLNTFKKSNGTQTERALVPYTRQEIANLTGLRVETVIRTLIKMKEEKKVDIIHRKLFY
jgi:CRP-like cAMP-binding protein